MKLAGKAAKHLRRAGVLLWRAAIGLEVDEAAEKAPDLEALEISVLELEGEVARLRKVIQDEDFRRRDAAALAAEAPNEGASIWTGELFPTGEPCEECGSADEIHDVDAHGIGTNLR